MSKRGTEFIELPVLQDDVRQVFYAEKPFGIAKACMTANNGEPCEVFDPEKAAKARYIGPAGVQLAMHHDRPLPEPDLGKPEQQMIHGELARRGRAGIDGSCAFIAEVEYCWRRPENQKDGENAQ